MEKKRLHEMTGKVVTKNRFHFLRMKFPESYRILLDSGITDDYSLGYSTVNGFRAGTFTPFYFYDLEREEKTSLVLHPFIFMDSAFIDHLEYTPEQAVAEIEKCLDLSRDLAGEFIATWHNYALSEKSQYKGWRKVLQAAVESSIDPSL